MRRVGERKCVDTAGEERWRLKRAANLLMVSVKICLFKVSLCDKAKDRLELVWPTLHNI